MLLNKISWRNEEILREKLEKRRCLYANINRGPFIILRSKFQIAAERLLSDKSIILFLFLLVFSTNPPKYIALYKLLYS